MFQPRKNMSSSYFWPSIFSATRNVSCTVGRMGLSWEIAKKDAKRHFKFKCLNVGHLDLKCETFVLQKDQTCRGCFGLPLFNLPSTHPIRPKQFSLRQIWIILPFLSKADVALHKLKYRLKPLAIPVHDMVVRSALLLFSHWHKSAHSDILSSYVMWCG